MRKEVFLAIVAGSALGLLIAFGVWRINANLRPKDDGTSTSSSPTASSNPTTSPVTNTGDFKVVLVKPDNLSVFTDTPVAVTGATKPNTWVALSSEDSDEIMNASDSGAFTSNVNLTGGANQIFATSFDADGSEADANLIEVFSSQYTPPADGATSIAYVGTVTDITNNVIQIKSASGDIQQITGTSDASYIDTRNNDTKTVKLTDVAIGDYLVAMGIKGQNNILNSSRILITDPLAKPTRRAFYGVVTDDSGINKFVAKNPKTNEEVTVTPAAGITVSGAEISLGNVKNNEKIIAVGEFKDGVLTARTIEVLK